MNKNKSRAGGCQFTSCVKPFHCNEVARTQFQLGKNGVLERKLLIS